jgi:hypothetical protein
MVIRFDTRALQSHAAHKAAPIGVEGDSQTKRKGGISEVDALVREARKSIKKYRDKEGISDIEPVSSKVSQESMDSKDSKERVKEEIIKEEEENDGEEPGPELTPEGGKDLPPNTTAAKAAELAMKKG